MGREPARHSLFLGAAAYVVWVIAGLGWSVLVATGAASRLRGQRPRQRMWGAVAGAALVAGTVGLAAVDAPLRIRWAVGRDAFVSVAETARSDLAPDVWGAMTAPSLLGAYRVSRAYQLGNAVFVETAGGGGIMSVAGFAHLPDGPTPGLVAQYRGVSFKPVGRGWYAWWASV